MIIPNESELIDAIAEATCKAVSDLFTEHPGHYYYCSLITSGEAHAPVLSAWSVEALNSAVCDLENQEEGRLAIKWSYADSPYLCYGEDHFVDVRQMFANRPEMKEQMTEDDWEAEFTLRLRAMELAMARLDAEGLFGTANDRLEIVVNVEVMPPDHTNTMRALRLNPPEALVHWLEEAAEPIPTSV